MACDHIIETEVYVEDEGWTVTTESACFDIDLHHYQCELCGYIGSYGSNY